MFENENNLEFTNRHDKAYELRKLKLYNESLESR
jgi:hypothetical protein